MKGCAFCPAHVTGFFKAELEEKQIEKLGTLGAGFSIQKGVKTSVEVEKLNEGKSYYKIRNSGFQPDNTQVTEFVVKDFLKLVKENFLVNVHHEITIPVGYGLGSSGAVALSLVYALNQAFKTKLSEPQIGQLAHKAEISCKTGLGDVLAAYHGGFEIRTKAGAPGVGRVEKISSEKSQNVVIMICFSPISTKKIMKEKMPSINGLGGKMVNRLIQLRNLNDFQDMSVEFAKYVDVITPKMNTVISDLHKNGIKCGVALFGETIFSLVPKKMERKVLKILKKYSGIIVNSPIDNIGARLI